VLLQRRPPTGVWAELWSLPEAPAETSLETALAGLPAKLDCQAEALAPFRHTFSHYHLDVQPLRWRKAVAATAVGETGQAWFSASELEPLGLPAPVRRLLSSLPD
jgi:A/G-specific adenine glycosylase